MSDEEVLCIGICQTDEFGYCIGCGRRAEEFPQPMPVPQQAAPSEALSKQLALESGKS